MTAMTPENVKDLLGDDLSLIYRCVKSAWTTYTSYPLSFRQAHTARSRASLVHDHFVDFARQTFEPRVGVHCHEINKLFIISFNSGVAVRFKKLDGCYRSSNIATQQSMDFLAQQNLPGVEAAVNLQAGYQLNALETDLKGVYLTQPESNANAWVIELSAAEHDTDTIHPIQKEAPAQKSNVVKFTKKRADDDTNNAGKS